MEDHHRIDLQKYKIEDLPEHLTRQPKGKFFDKQALLKRKKQKEFNQRRSKIMRKNLVNTDYHSISPQKCRKGKSRYPKIEVFISIENFKTSEEIIAVVKKKSAYDKT